MLEVDPLGHVQRGGVHGEAGALAAEERHLQSREAAQLGGGAIVDAESAHSQAMGSGASTGTIVNRTRPPSSGTTHVGSCVCSASSSSRGNAKTAPGWAAGRVSAVMAPASETSISTSAPIRRRWFSSTERVVS
jgi:hypothetical protein